MTALQPAGDGTFIAIAPCAECGSTRLMVDDTPYCADCEPEPSRVLTTVDARWLDDVLALCQKVSDLGYSDLALEARRLFYEAGR